MDVNSIQEIPASKNFRKLNSKIPNSRRYKERANVSRLPTPLAFYKQLGINLKGSNEWRSAKCPFHDDKHASFSINTVHGGFICHACGAKGDMLKFYMDYKKVNFKTACTELDLWESY